MAGTRRRSRIRDAARQHAPRSQSHAEAADAESGHAADSEAPAQVAEKSVDSGSPPLSPPQKRSTRGTCRRCQAAVGEFYNAFEKITGTYYLPVMSGSYSSRLRAHGRQKPATQGEKRSPLDGCLIQPLACPNPACGDLLGFHVVDAPESSQAFRGRDFFKLPRIDLRCEVSPGRFQVVEPQVEAARPSESESPPAAPATREEFQPAPSASASASAMEVDSRPPHAAHAPSHAHAAHAAHAPHPQHAHHGQHAPVQHHAPGPLHHPSQPLQQVEANRQPLPPPLQSPRAAQAHGGAPQKSPSNPLPSPGVKPLHDVHFAQPQAREGGGGVANRGRELPPVMAPSHSPADRHRANGQYYPRAQSEVTLDAIERLQTQISQNSGAVSVHGRDLTQLKETAAHVEEGLRRDFQGQIHQQNLDIRRIDEAVGRLQHEMHDTRQLLEVINREVHALGTRSLAAPAPATISAQDSALELMAHQIANMSLKANEVDTLKITIEIMKNKIQRLEDAAIGGNPPSSAHPALSPQERHSQVAQAMTAYHPSQPSHAATPVHPGHRQASFQSHGSHSAATPELSQRQDSTPIQSSWVPVNVSAKRPHPNGVEHEQHGPPVESPKRPKLSILESRAGLAGSQHPQHVYEHMDTDESDSRLTHAHAGHSQSQLQNHHSHESLAEMTPTQPTIPSHHSQHFPPYGTQDGPSDESWRPESQRMVEHRTPRGRGRGGGPGSRGGRVRKSLPSQIHLGTPEWEREDWQGVTESQTSPDGYYNHVHRSGRGIIRRGSGGSTRGRPPSSSGRAVSLGMQGVTPGLAVSLQCDPYAHTKKTRSKPTRNADGILIRKDGRPDMRSQSSAANLRKVHARKEELKDGEREFTPLSSTQPRTSSLGPETPSPTSNLPGGHGHGQESLTSSVQKKHSAIMGKMFPGGVDESRREHDLSRKVFEEGQSHEAQPKFQAHNRHHLHGQHGHGPVERSAPGIKREAVERRMLDSQSPNDGDVDMDREEGEGDVEGSTPSDDAEHYHDAEARHEIQAQGQTHERSTASANTLQSSSTAQAMPPSTADTSQTLDAASGTAPVAAST